MSYSYIEGQSFWQTNFKETVDKNREKFCDSFLTHPKYEEYLEKRKVCNDAKKAAYNSKANFYYFLIILGAIFATILIVPAYWAWKKFKQVKNQRAEKRSVYEQHLQECIEFKMAHFADLAPLASYFEETYALMNYEHIGPLTDSLLKELNRHSLIDLSYDNEKNPLSTAWGIWNKRLVVLEVSQQKEIHEIRTYTGSTTITVPDGNGGFRQEVRTASMTYPYHDVDNTSIRYMAFMKSCENLEFKFVKTKLLKLKSKKQPEMDNEKFSKNFEWNFNDPVQFRMIFTPHKQEVFLNEYYVNSKKVHDADKISKRLGFLFNLYKEKVPGYSDKWENVSTRYNNFLRSKNLEFEKMLSELSGDVKQWIVGNFLKLKHLWTTPILHSENHKDIITRVQPKNDYCAYLPHYLLNNLLTTPLIKYTSDCFNIIDDGSKQTNKYKTIVAHTYNVHGRSYEHIHRTAYVNEVPIDYIHCEPHDITKQITYCYRAMTKTMTRNITKHLDEINQSLSEYDAQLTYNNNFIVVLHPINTPLDVILNAIYNATKTLTKGNSNLNSNKNTQ